jgi:hypothetical protein
MKFNAKRAKDAGKRSGAARKQASVMVEGLANAAARVDLTVEALSAARKAGCSAFKPGNRVNIAELESWLLENGDIVNDGESLIRRDSPSGRVARHSLRKSLGEPIDGGTQPIHCRFYLLFNYVITMLLHNLTVGYARTKITSMPPSTKLPAVVTRADKSKRAGIQCDFKPKASQRRIRFASDDDAKSAGTWAIKKYHETFKALAK